jgi:hypothetical protein
MVMLGMMTILELEMVLQRMRMQPLEKMVLKMLLLALAEKLKKGAVMTVLVQTGMKMMPLSDRWA